MSEFDNAIKWLMDDLEMDMSTANVNALQLLWDKHKDALEALNAIRTGTIALDNWVLKNSPETIVYAKDLTDEGLMSFVADEALRKD